MALLLSFLLFLSLFLHFNLAFRLGIIGMSAKSTTSQVSIAKNTQRSMFEDKSEKLETSVFVPGAFSPIERVVLTANGNLQRILSAYYGLPVTVEVKRCVDLGEGLFDREVEVLVQGQVIYNAVSQVQIRSEECRRAVSEQQVGIGQLFKHFKLTPNFDLLRAGRYAVYSGISSGSSSGVVDGSVRSIHTTTLDYPLADSYSPGNAHHGIDSGSGSGSGSDSGVSTSSKDSGVYSLWREYDLFDPNHVHCRITERYTPDFLSLCS